MLLRGDIDACDANQADPGETYDPLGLADDPEIFAELKVNETENGRLGMFSVSCYIMDAIAISEGRVEKPNIADTYGTRSPCLSLLGTPVAMLTAWGFVSHN